MLVTGSFCEGRLPVLRAAPHRRVLKVEVPFAGGCRAAGRFAGGLALVSASAASSRRYARRRGCRRPAAVRLQAGGTGPSFDVVVIGAGLGGLACAAALGKAGRRVLVLEAHSVCGGCAHAFTRKAPGGGEYVFDSGPSILTDMGPRNPLRLVMDYVGASDDVEWIYYDGWGMLTPEGPWRLELGNQSFRDEVLPRYGVPAEEFDEVARACAPLAQVGRDIPGVVLRDDEWQLLPLLLKFPGAVIPAIRDAAKLNEPFSKVLDQLEEEGKLRKGSWLRSWLDALAFSLSGLDCSGTTTAAMAFTMDELHWPGTRGLAYPKGGMGSVIEALRKAVERQGGEIRTGVRVEELILEGRRAVGVRCSSSQGGDILASEAVVCNASIWDSANLLPKDNASLDEMRTDWQDTPMTRSYLHLHVGLDAEGLDLSKLEPHYTSMASWEDVTAEQNMVAISNPALLDSSLCPPGKLVLHLYGAGNEPFDIWEAAQAKSRGAYEELKELRAQRLWQALEEIVPDAKSRAEVALVGSPMTHRRYLRRAAGTYGPAPIFGRFGAGEVPFRTAGDALPHRRGVDEQEAGVEGLLLCGDSTFPGIGVPAAVVSGLSAAHTNLSVWEHLDLLGRAGY
eukprot:TRINITY_DN92520_c0_g1_i1.p1 TRINITY_DN92520_c0_g1~~TRINITY_DN92520_c0_g1_i1.p1  ORF type:complete len:633 (-),score=130.26 TRINITY_DN92520_c0_g1_i1:4-1869(-)